MTGRVTRWAVGGLGVGLLPLVLAYLVRSYYLPQPPPLRDVLGSGDGLLVVVSWLSASLLELWAAPAARQRLRNGLATFALGLLCLAWVAYGCLSADSVTGRVQTRQQAHYAAVGTAGLLALAAAVSAGAVAVATPVQEEETSA